MTNLLQNLQKNLRKKEDCLPKSENEIRIASEIVDILFEHVNRCIDENRGKKKLSFYEKLIVRNALNPTRSGTKDFVAGMVPEDIKFLLDDIEKVLRNRKQ